MINLYLYTAIDEFSSTELIDQMNNAVMNGETEITIHINSEGGSVFKGFAIINTMLQLQKDGITVNTHVGGLAGSMAGVIAMFGDTVSMNDFGMLMIHDPSLSTGQRPDEKQIEILSKVRESLVSIFVNRRHKDEDEIKSIMSNETWFNAVESLENGLIDEVVETGVVIDDNVSSMIYEIANQLSLNENTIQKINKIKMKDICNKLGIEETENVESINNAIDVLVENKVAEIKNEIEVLNESIVEKNEVIETQNEEIENFKIEKANTLIDNAISEGKIKDDSKDSWIEKAVENYDDTASMLDSINVSPVNIMDSVSTEQPENADEKTFDDYMNEGSAGDLMNNNPELYKKLYMNKFGVEIKL